MWDSEETRGRMGMCDSEGPLRQEFFLDKRFTRRVINGIGVHTNRETACQGHMVGSGPMRQSEIPL